MGLVLLFVLAIVAATPRDVAAQRHTIETWGIDAGLPNNALTQIIQTRDGYLWIATWAGTMRFDGVRFTPVAENLPNDRALALLEDAAGAVWIGTSGGGLSRWQAGRVDTFTTTQGLAGTEVRSLTSDRDGRVWVATENGLTAIDRGQMTTWRTDQGLPSNLVNHVSRGVDRSSVWIATAGGVCQAQRTHLNCDLDITAAGQPSTVLEDASGRLWIGTSAGLYARDVGKTGECSPIACFSGRAVTSLLEDRQGNLWVGFADGSLAARTSHGVIEYTAAHGLPPGAAVSLYEDPEGSIWLASYNGGLARLRPQRVTVFSTADGLPAKVAGSIVQDANGTIWAGTQCGPVSELRLRKFVARFAEYTGGACAWSILAARDGSLWIGTRDAGLFHWDGRRMRSFDRDDGLSDVRIAGLFEDRDHTVWIGTEHGGVHRYANGQLSRAFGPADGLASGYVSNFAQDRDGRVWLGSVANGLSVFEAGRFRTLTGNDAPPSPNISALLVDSHGDLWIGTPAKGLFRRRNGRYEAFGVEQGLGDRLVAIIVEDRDSNLWVSTARGIARLERARINAVADGRSHSLEPIMLDRADGLLNTEGSGGGMDPSGLRDRDGRLWFSTIDGIVMVDPATFPTNRRPPPALIESVRLGDRAANVEDAVLRVPAGTPSLEIAFTAFSLLMPHKVRFRYRLEGLDDNWRDAGARRSATFSRLRPRTYTFQVIAANNDGVWTEQPAALQLIVEPFWWERRGLQLAALVCLLVATGVGVRTVSLRRARARLAELEREQALDRERARIARDLHDDLGARLSHIALLADHTSSTNGRDRLAMAARDAAEAMDELVWTVSARHDTVDSLANYATRFAQEHIGAAGLRFRAHMPPELNGHTLGSDVRRHLFLAFKEAVNNAVKHSHGSEIRIALDVSGNALKLEVADNGRGLPADGGDATGHGLTNLAERMQAAKGTLQVESSPGTGTRIVFTVPMSS